MFFVGSIGTLLRGVVFLIIISLIANAKIKKYVKKHEIVDGGTIKTASFLTVLTYVVSIELCLCTTYLDGAIWIPLGFLAYGVLGTIAHIFVRGHRRLYGKNKATTILYGLTHHCWEVLQLIGLAIRTVVDIIASFIADDWKQTNKRIKAREETEKYFRENSVDKPNNYQDGLNIAYRDFLSNSSVDDNSEAKKIFADEYFKKVYDK